MLLDGRMQAEDDKAAANAPASWHGPDVGPCLSNGSYARLFATTVTTRSFVMTTSIGSVLSGEGKVFANGHGSVERVILRKGGKIERHNHPGKDVLVCVLRGNLNVVLDDSEKHALHAGDTLVFAGKHFFVAEAADDVLIIHIVINV